jgi:LmbE family N-acetylglucosaminyl deacetylase
MSNQLNYGTRNKLVLATGAHFDDVEAGIGGTLMKHAEKGDRVHIIITSSDEFRTGYVNVRLKEQISAMESLGLNSTNLTLFSMKDDESSIISSLDVMSPDVIYTPYEDDTHQDHRRCSKIAQSVGRKRNIMTVFYYCGSSIDFYPNMFSIFDFKRKMKAINCYKSQMECGALKLDRRKKMEAYWATLISDDEDCYAEGLIVRKMIYEV